ncbi:MAG: putative bifunctional diguanylate cyclase/phosphodiesterase [Myxococcota bacterium]
MELRSIVHILLLEDSDVDALRLTELLRDRGHDASIQRVSALQDAIQVMRQQPIQLGLVDLNVVDSRGLNTLVKLLETGVDVPFVVLSGQSDIKTAAAAVEAGAQDYLVKDRLDAETLERSLRHAVSRHHLSAQLRESERRYALAMAGAHDGLWDWDVQSDRLFVSERWAEMLRLSPSAVIDCWDRWLGVVHPADRSALADAVERHCDGETPHLEVEHRMRTGDGETVWVLTRGVLERDARGRPARMAGSLSDITRFKEVEARLRHDATHDRLTGLPNRVVLLDRLKMTMVRRTKKPYALLFLDLDRFKLINDSMGHATGDRFLQAFVERVRPLLRPTDTFARLGGDEFCILLDDAQSVHDAKRVVDRIHGALSDPLWVDGQRLYASVSIGSADSSVGYESPEDVVRDADIAMYQAKARRRGDRGRSWRDAHSGVVERFALETELRSALSNGEMGVVYQPIISMRTGELDGFEALLRWHSPTRGLVGPEVFIPIAKDTGILSRLGHWVIDQAATDLSELTRRTGADWSVSINLSPHELLEPDLEAWIREVLRRSRLDPARLVLEVTEDVLLDHSAAALEAFDRLKRLGIGIDLDDFGTGFSSLSHLRQFPVDRLKIDRSFVRDMRERKEDREIIRAIVALGRTLEKGVVAEGIENREQLAMLASFGCGYGQGFLFAHPDNLSLYQELGAYRPASMAWSGSGLR